MHGETTRRGFLGWLAMLVAGVVGVTATGTLRAGYLTGKITGDEKYTPSVIGKEPPQALTFDDVFTSSEWHHETTVDLFGTVIARSTKFEGTLRSGRTLDDARAVLCVTVSPGWHKASESWVMSECRTRLTVETVGGKVREPVVWRGPLDADLAKWTATAMG